MKWFASLGLLIFVACRAQSSDGAPEPKTVAPGVLQLGTIQHPRVTESSGLVVSRQNPDLFWTHNDGGGKRQVLYAMTRTGQPLAEFRITGAVLEDWEDIAADDKGRLFLGDTGNNDEKRQSIAVHEIPEPDIKATQNGLARVTRTWNLRFPAKPFDCESLFVRGEQGYLISKVFDDERADIYSFSLTNTAPFQTLEAVAEVRIDSPVTGAALSPDGELLAMVAKNGAYVFRINGHVARAGKGKPFHTKFKHEHIEACTFVPEGLLVTAESREIFLFTDDAFRSGPAKKK
ncbi:MAG TPA: hypothetical protein VM029_16300 [Opitutaceae bacterium]|nr:hypothetical protein [Opitutaceae bacterium]